MIPPRLGNQRIKNRIGYMDVSTMHDSVETCTAVGGNYLAKGDTEAALNAFKKAYVVAKKNGSSDSIRQTMFNLGAVHVAAQKFSEGIEILKSVAALKASSAEAEPFEGDVYYNLGLACELHGSDVESIRYFENAAKMYAMNQRSNLTVGEVQCRLGRLYSRLEEYGKAAKTYGIAAMVFESAGELEQQAICLCHEASLLEMNKRSEDAMKIAAQCVVLCQKIPDANCFGKLYNELGLLYAKCQRPAQAEACFKLALPLLTKDLRSLAVVQQNLGAVYNCLGDYQMSLKHHESAAALYVRSGSRNGQGQCFSNWAFAYAQLGDIESASEYYLHALQAAKDTKDRHDRWQALEGLGTVAFRLKRLDRAVVYFQKALSALSDSEEAAQSRIVDKLTQVLELKLATKKEAETHKRDNQKAEGEINQPMKKTVSLIYTVPRTQGLSKNQTHDSASSARTPKTNTSQEHSAEEAAKDTADHPSLSSVAKIPKKEDQRADRAAVTEAQKKDAAVKDDELVKSYQQKLESKETESGSNTSTDDDDSDDDTTTETEQPPPPSYPMRTAPHAPASSSKHLLPSGTYLHPMFEAQNMGKTSTTSSQINESDYMTIPVHETSPEAPTLPPRLYREPSASKSDVTKSSAVKDSTVKLPRRPNPEQKQKSSACSVM